MGTLFSHGPRPYHSVNQNDVVSFIKEIKHIIKVTGYTFNDVMRIYEYLEYQRQNDIAIDDGDFMDENLSGIGHILEEMKFYDQNL